MGNAIEISCEEFLSTLAPCPHCGGPAFYDGDMDAPERGVGFCIQCQPCNLSLWSFHGDSLSDVAARWNKQQKPTVETLLAMLKPLVWENYGDKLFRDEKCLLGSYTVREEKEIRADGVFVTFRWDFRAYCGRDSLDTPRRSRGACDSIDHGKQLCQLDYQSRVRALFEE